MLKADDFTGLWSRNCAYLLEEERQFYNLKDYGDASVVHYGDDVEWF